MFSLGERPTAYLRVRSRTEKRIGVGAKLCLRVRQAALDPEVVINTHSHVSHLF
jgi:hypothetical protein